MVGTDRFVTKLNPDADELRETVERLQREVEELRESRRRLAFASDADRRRIERALHEGVQQDLVALAVNLQLARSLVESQPAEARSLVDGMARDVQQSLGETARLAQRIYPPLLGPGDLATALRAAAATLGVHASVEVAVDDEHDPDVVRTVYGCCVEVLERSGKDGRATIAIRTEGRALALVVTANPDAAVDDLKDRVEALGGRLTIDSQPDGSTRLTGSL